MQCKDYKIIYIIIYQGCTAVPVLGLRGGRAPSGRRWTPCGGHPPPWSSRGSVAPSARGPGRCWPRCWRTPGGRGLPPARPAPAPRTAARAAAGPSPLPPEPRLPATATGLRGSWSRRTHDHRGPAAARHWTRTLILISPSAARFSARPKRCEATKFETLQITNLKERLILRLATKFATCLTLTRYSLNQQ